MTSLPPLLRNPRERMGSVPVGYAEPLALGLTLLSPRRCHLLRGLGRVAELIATPVSVPTILATLTRLNGRRFTRCRNGKPLGLVSRAVGLPRQCLNDFHAVHAAISENLGLVSRPDSKLPTTRHGA